MLGPDLLRYLTARKLANYARYRRDLRRRETTTSSLPPAIVVQPSGHCDSNCALCPVGRGLDGRRKGFLTFQVFDRVIEDMRHALVKVAFADKGEPFLNPEIFRMIARAEERGVRTYASTNLHAFTERRIDDLLRSGLSHLTVSLHGASRETYAAYQRGRQLADTVEKLRLLRDRRGGRRKPVVRLGFAVTKKNQHELDAMRAFAARFGFEHDIYTASLNLRFHGGDAAARLVDEWAQDRDFPARGNRSNRRSDILAVYDAYRGGRAPAQDDRRVFARYSCTDPWRSFVLSWDGTVALCCVDFTKRSMGDVARAGVRDIWNSPEYREIRGYLRAPGSAPAASPCATCVRY